MYVNNNTDRFNPYSQYAFMRKYGKEVIFVVVNFSDRDVACSVNIPKHAFDYMQLPEKVVSATDLLTGDSVRLSLVADSSVELNVPAYGGRIYKFIV